MTDTIGLFEAENSVRPTILVDWDTVNGNQKIQRWLHARGKIFNLTLLVTNPDHRDYDQSTEVPGVTVEFDTVIRNTGAKRDLEFKLNALSILNDVSTSKPVAAIEGNFIVRYEFAAIGLIALSESDVK